jgi:hypothetical protein
MADTTPHGDQLATVEALPDGQRLSDWYEGHGISRATAQRMLAAAGITPGRARLPGVKSPVAWLDARQLGRLDEMADRMAMGATVAEAAGSALSRPEPAQPPAARPGQPKPPQAPAHAGLSQLEALALRAQAAQALIATGQPVSTAEAELLLLAHPGGDRVTAGGITAVRIGRNRWRIVTTEPA